MTPIIQATQITKSFGKLKVVNKLSLEVYAGELFVLVGPDGAGKTTTLRLLSGVMLPDEGKIKIKNYDTRHQFKEIQRFLGYMPQELGLYHDLTVMENISFYSDLYEVPKEEGKKRLKELLEITNLFAFTRRKAGDLSGGMRQKLGLICALIHAPEILILDEPTMGIDPVSRDDFWQILVKLQKTGITIVVATSYLDEAERAQRVGLMYQGRLQKVGSLKELKQPLMGKILEIRSSAVRALKERLANITGIKHIFLKGNSLRIIGDDLKGIKKAVVKMLSSQGISFELEETIPTLEDVFIESINESIQH